MLEIKDLVAGYEQRVLIRHLFLSLPAPAFVAIVGHNGGGKSTFFKILTGQVPFQQGQIWLLGHNLQSLSHRAATGLLSYLPQKNTVSFPIPVSNLVVMGLLRNKHFLENYNAADYLRVATLLETLEIPHLANRDFTQLSGGEQQLVWLAQLMLQDTRLCLLDEPTQQLDIYHKKKVFELLTSWVSQQRKTVLCITHDLLNLYEYSGYLLNISKPHPQLEVLSPQTIDQNVAFLEKKPA
ncbi:ABC transporter ATP-binding protein [Adhaeribacter pallidiroseus]|uniref:Cobalamin import ATP-binding protein BtuD n=1 Tax=Adhaeribacter pallidiroseus TaxID=2072847 RepID=A0A369QIG1_9BACT|nr:ABC transporter ATP-binding protein [Adhaeribacter pallidiroseus]RDC64703.1 Cobalamin import ATP-binding protein BtuD [Adhaeribacter pallidiroseus]